MTDLIASIAPWLCAVAAAFCAGAALGYYTRAADERAEAEERAARHD